MLDTLVKSLMRSRSITIKAIHIIVILYIGNIFGSTIYLISHLIHRILMSILHMEYIKADDSLYIDMISIGIMTISILAISKIIEYKMEE